MNKRDYLPLIADLANHRYHSSSLTYGIASTYSLCYINYYNEDDKKL